MIRVFFAVFLGLFVLAAGAAGGVLYLFYHYGRGLPDYQQLADYRPPVVTRVHARDGRLIAEFAREKRVFVPIAAMPKQVIKAFLAAEDKNFYDHPGIDAFGVVRAAVINLSQLGSDRRPVGGSTITQQVAKNFLLSGEVSITRKIKEAILAFRIERTFSKDRILELYLNEIYLGMGSYGVAAAALNYFNVSLDQLSIAELAFLAALPKAPNNYHPLRNPDAALARRNYVIQRMVDEGYISAGEGRAAAATPLTIRSRDATEFVDASYFGEEIRRELVQRYGEDGVYGGGLSVHSSLDPHLQKLATQALRDGLAAYDRRHGWRGALGKLAFGKPWQPQLDAFPAPKGLGDWRLAVVLRLKSDYAQIGFADGSAGMIPLKELTWARKSLPGGRRGPAVRAVGDVLSVADVIAVEPLQGQDAAGKAGRYALRQIPEVEGGLVAIDPHTGRVRAMAGGFDYDRSQFNRVTQAARQPGSAFKPFVYVAALEAGYTPATLLLDAPFVIDQGPGKGKWKPANYTKKFYGPSPMRLGIEKSRNLMTVRLAQTLGMEHVAEYAKRFGVAERLPNMLSMSLGAGETTLMRLTAGYAMFVNGGKQIEPSLIDRIQDRNGRVVYRHDRRRCEGCNGITWRSQLPPGLPDTRPQVAEPQSAYQMVSMLQGVVLRGTGQRIRAVNRPLAGKTGTTDDSMDTWFIGFSPDLAVGVFVGYDEPRSLGKGETGSTVAAPIFRDFMAAALEGQKAIPFRIPPDIRLVRVNPRTGTPARRGERGVILEAFRAGTEPSESDRPVLGGVPATTRMRGPSGLY